MPLAAPDNTTRLFRAFADPTRLRLLSLLREAARDGQSGEVCVCDLTGILGVPQPTASRHLAYLRQAGLVQCRREGAWCYYRLSPAAGPVERKLLATLEACATTMPDLAADARKLRSSGCCAASACC